MSLRIRKIRDYEATVEKEMITLISGQNDFLFVDSWQNGPIWDLTSLGQQL